MAMNIVRCLSAGVMLVAITAGAARAHASVQYSVTHIGTLNNLNTEPYAINNNGQITGYSVSGSNTAYRWDEVNGMQAIWSSSSLPYSLGNAINDSGTVAGVVGPNAGSLTPLTLTSTLTPTVLSNLPGTAVTSARQALGINNAGVAVGFAANSSNINKIARWNPDGSVTAIDGFAADRNSVARDINNNGQIVGNSIMPGTFLQHAFVYDNGTLTDLGTPSGGTRSEAFAINDAGQVVGWSHDTGNTPIGFVWQNGNFTSLGTIAGLDGSSIPAAINSSGQVVGRVGNNANLARAFYWDSTNGIVDLNTLIDPSLGITLRDARGINDDGWIIAWGTFPGGSISTGKRAFLLRPVPGAPGIALLAIGGLAAARRRR